MPQVRELHDRTDFDALLAESHVRPVALLKHSSACSLSAYGRREFVRLDEATDPPLYALVVQVARDVSNYVSERLGVRHETPQVLLIHGGEAVFAASHFDVSAEALRAAARDVSGVSS